MLDRQTSLLAGENHGAVSLLVRLWIPLSVFNNIAIHSCGLQRKLKSNPSLMMENAWYL